MRLSQEVLSFLDTFDSEDGSPEKVKEWEETLRGVNFIVDHLIASRETISDGRFASIEKFAAEMPEGIEYLLDRWYTRDVVTAVSGYVRRTMQLSGLEGSSLPSKTTNGYLREAVRTYIFGFPQASIALSRAALEQALKEELGHQGNQIILKRKGLLDEAEGAGLIDTVIRKTVRKIFSEADAVLHEKPADLSRAYDVLLMLRGVLQHLYAE